MCVSGLPWSRRRGGPAPPTTPWIETCGSLVWMSKRRKPSYIARSPRSVDGDGLDLAQAREHFLRKEPDTLFRLGVRHEARAADQTQVAEAADLVVEVHHLLVDGIGIAHEQDALRHRLLRGNRREPRGVLTGREHGARCGGSRRRAIELRRG